MAKVITFSRTFPSYHPKKGEPTYFVEAILTQLGIKYKTGKYYKWLIENNPKISEVFLMKFFDSLKRDILPKSHTIRNHKKSLKKGDFIEAKCWACKPYNKTVEGFWQIKFAPDIEIKNVFDFKIEIDKDYICVFIDNYPFYEENKSMVTQVEALDKLANNDALSLVDFKNWFKWGTPFDGQILCWANGIEY